MTLHNSFNIEPGVWHNGSTAVVVENIVTHYYSDGVIKQHNDPKVIYRDLEFKINEHIVYEMELSLFKSKFRKG